MSKQPPPQDAVWPNGTVFTVGHSTLPIERFLSLLATYGIGQLADVRTVPRSRTNPQFNFDSLPKSLKKAGIGYRHIARLGGLRARQKAMTQSPNTFWTNKSFQNYADYALSESFRQGLHELEVLAAEQSCVLMCAEAVWWRCHRRIIADYLLAEGYPVLHIMGLGKLEPARMTEAAAPAGDGKLQYIG